MGKTVPKGYRRSEERVDGERHIVLYVQNVSARQMDEKRRRKASLLQEMFLAAEGSESITTASGLVDVHKKRCKKPT